MSLERWSTAKHLPLIHEWTRLRKLGPDAGDVSLLPPLGFVSDNIVAGFLFVVAGGCKLGFIDSFVSDPRTTSEQRGKAIVEIITAIVADAKDLGLHALCGAVSVPSLALHAKNFGFTVIDNCHYFYGKV